MKIRYKHSNSKVCEGQCKVDEVSEETLYLTTWLLENEMGYRGLTETMF